MKKQYAIMGIFAHPDDETFGPGGTLAKYSYLSHKTYVLTATRGQAGQSSNRRIYLGTGYHRETELRRAAQILGVHQVMILDFFDGTLNEHQLPILKKEIEREVNIVNPDIIIIFDKTGISLHLDHVAVTKAVLQLYDEKRINPKKLYHFGMTKQMHKLLGINTCLCENKLTKINIKDFWLIKIKAMKAHGSQQKDFRRMLERYKMLKKTSHNLWHFEHFELARTTLNNLKFPEDDLLSGL